MGTDEREDRTIEELLQEKTYQGMTDGEIGKVIAYACQEVRREVEQSATMAALQQTQAAMAAAYAEEAKRSNRILEALVSRGVELQEVEDGEA